MKRILAALTSALLLVLSFPRFDFEFLAWVALVPLFLAIRNKSLKSAAGLSFLTGIIFFESVCSWVNVVKGYKLVDDLVLGIYLGSYFALFGLLLNFTSNKTRFPSIMIAPFLWISIEYLRSHAGFLAFPWALLGHSQYLNLPIIQISSLTGVYGVSFLIVMVNASLSEFLSYLISKKERRTISNPLPIKQVIIPLLFLGASLIYGHTVISQQPVGDKINISVIQGNIPQGIKWNSEFLRQNLDKHIRLSKEASNGSNTSLIIWPETSIPGFLTQDLYLSQTILRLAKETETCLLIGSSQRPKFGQRKFRKTHSFNSAFLISPRGIEKRYDKINLLPFSEYLPYEDSLPWPSRFVSMTDNFIAGKDYTVFNLNGTKFGVLICWENIFPDLFRQFVKNGANFMINITNEAWFGETSAPYQFLSMSVFRAVENRISVVRSANTGISCFINPFGEIMGRVKNNNKDIFVEGFLTMGIPLSHKKTFYTLYGDIFVYTILIITIVMLALSFLKIKIK